MTVPIEVQLQDCSVTTSHKLRLVLVDTDGMWLELYLPLEDTPAGVRLLKLVTELTSEALGQLGRTGVRLTSIWWEPREEDQA